MVSHLNLICISMMANDIEPLLIFIDNMDIVFRKVPIHVFCPGFFAFFLLVCGSFLCLLDMSPLSNICIVSNFSHFMGSFSLF